MAGVEKPRILVVEDSFILADLLCDLLSEMGVEPIGPVATLEAASRIVQETDLDAALLDIEVRDGTTYAICRSLQQLGVPFSLLTGRKCQSVRAEFGNVPIIAKPFEWTSVERAVTRMLNFEPGRRTAPNALPGTETARRDSTGYRHFSG